MYERRGHLRRYARPQPVRGHPHTRTDTAVVPEPVVHAAQKGHWSGNTDLST